ncbi:MAG TPA: DUF481 domain-containing protein [Gemmatimonadota bacterium]|nr:DUF481 domain-containing protein [Gemmatimonadota bacterium]
MILTSAGAFAQRTDVAVLANGDRITGEVMRLDRGRLEFKTDDAGTLYLEWDALVSVVTTRIVEVVSEDGTRRVGSLVPAADWNIAVSTPGGTDSLPLAVITHIAPVGRGFWRQLEGSIDAGFSYSRSSGVAQLNVNSSTVYRRPAFKARLIAALTYTRQRDESERDDRGSVELGYRRFRWPRAFVGALARFETNESVGLELRSLIAAAVGPRLINTNRAEMFAGAGLAFNDERGVDVEPSQNMEGLLLFGLSYFTYDQPSTSMDIFLSYYPSPGRHRVQLDAGVRREIWKDLFVALNLYDTYDSEPPNPEASTNDVGVMLSIGWNY